MSRINLIFCQSWRKFTIGYFGTSFNILKMLIAVNPGSNYMDLSDMPMESGQQKAMMWQTGYMGDSGIQSGVTTQAPSVSSKHGLKDEIMEPATPDNMDTSRIMYTDWNQEQNYNTAPQAGYTQEQVDEVNILLQLHKLTLPI